MCVFFGPVRTRAKWLEDQHLSVSSRKGPVPLDGPHGSAL